MHGNGRLGAPNERVFLTHFMRPRLPSLNALRTFEAAARHGSFKGAAAELCVSHSAVSHQIKQLEHSLGVELFLRKSRSVELTRIGRTYYPPLRDAFDRIAEATEVAVYSKTNTALTVQVSTAVPAWGTAPGTAGSPPDVAE